MMDAYKDLPPHCKALLPAPITVITVMIDITEYINAGCLGRTALAKGVLNV